MCGTEAGYLLALQHMLSVMFHITL